MTLPQKILIALLKPLFWILFSKKVQGKENVPLTGPLIVVSNHIHNIDPFLIIISFPRWIDFMAKEELFRSPLLKPIMLWAGGFSAQRQGTMKEKQAVIRKAKNILDAGFVLGMFPEGSRSHDGKLRAAKSGSAVLAARTDVPVLPIGITGTDKIKGLNWLWKRHCITISIGEPFKLPYINDKLTKSQMKSLTSYLMHNIASLLPPEYQGVYAVDESPNL